MRVVDLCSGCGGASEGLRQAGFPVTLAVDTWRMALDSHKANHPDAEHVLSDVRALVGSVGRADVVIASPPCQQFSSIGPRPKEYDFSVVDACLAIIEEARPRWFWVENVPKCEPYLRERGLPTSFFTASAFGLPHRRKRIFAGRYARPLATGIARETVPTPLASDGKRTRVSDSYQAKMKKGYTWRQPTLAEAKERMGFPADYVILGGKERSLRQVGNAVCPPVARAIAAAQHEDARHVEVRAIA